MVAESGLKSFKRERKVKNYEIGVKFDFFHPVCEYLWLRIVCCCRWRAIKNKDGLVIQVVYRYYDLFIQESTRAGLGLVVWVLVMELALYTMALARLRDLHTY